MSESPARSGSSTQRVGQVTIRSSSACEMTRAPVAAVEHLLEHDHLTDAFEPERVDDVERVVEQDLLATPQLIGVAPTETPRPAASGRR